MAVQTQHRQIGDRRQAIAAQLTRPDGSVVDLTSLTVRFEMLDSQNNSKVAETDTGVTVTDVANGKVKYSPVAVDVDTEGTFHAYFLVYEDTLYEHFPVEKGHLRIQIHDQA